MMHGWGYGFSGGWLGWFGPILMVLIVAAVIAGVVLLIKWLVGRSSQPEQGDSALDILKRRYARGEISGEEYEKMKKDLL